MRRGVAWQGMARGKGRRMATECMARGVAWQRGAWQGMARGKGWRVARGGACEGAAHLQRAHVLLAVRGAVEPQ